MLEGGPLELKGGVLVVIISRKGMLERGGGRTVVREMFEGEVSVIDGKNT